MDYIGMREDLDVMQYRLSVSACQAAMWADYLRAYHLQQLQREAIDFFNELLNRIPRTGNR